MPHGTFPSLRSPSCDFSTADHPMSDWLTLLLQQAQDYALVLLFVLVLAESTAILGLLIPGTVLMLAMGAMIGQGKMDFWAACAVGFVAALIGDGVSYWLGYRHRQWLQRLPILQQQRKLLVQAKMVLRQHGPVGIFAGRFIGPTRPVLPLVAGMLAMPRRRFAPACVVACLLWTPAFLLPGILAGASVGLAEQGVLGFPALLTAALCAVALAIWLNWQSGLQLWQHGRWQALPRHLRWGTPSSGLAVIGLGWLLLTHPQAGPYGARLWAVMS